MKRSLLPEIIISVETFIILLYTLFECLPNVLDCHS